MLLYFFNAAHFAGSIRRRFFFALIYNAEYFVWPVFLLAMTLLTGRGPYEGKVPGLMCVMPCLMLLISFYALSSSPQVSDLSLFWSTAVSAAIVGLLFFLPMRDKGEQARTARAVPAGQSYAPLEQVSFEEFVYRHGISQRKRELLKLLLQGNSTKKIAEAMGITEYTVRLHIHEILRTTGLKNRKVLLDTIRP